MVILLHKVFLVEYSWSMYRNNVSNKGSISPNIACSVAKFMIFKVADFLSFMYELCVLQHFLFYMFTTGGCLNWRIFSLISYFFESNDGVGALRSRSLVHFLKKRGFDVDIVKRNTFGSIGEKNFYLWTILCAFKVLFSKQKNVYVSCGPFNHLLFILLACFIRKKSLL